MSKKFYNRDSDKNEDAIPMTDNHSPDVRQIMERVRAAAAKQAAQADPAGETSASLSDRGAEDRPSGPGVRHTFFGTDFLDPDRNDFHLRELLELHDRMFIFNVYQVLLKRDPDLEGFNNYLHMLRSGRVDKVWVIAVFRYSDEGKRKNVRVRGLRWAIFKWALKKPPVVGRLLHYALSLFGLRRIDTELEKTRLEMGRLYEETGQALAWIEARFESRLAEKADKADLAEKADFQDINLYLRAVNQVLDMVCVQSPPGAPGAQPAPGPDPDRVADDAYYSVHAELFDARETTRRRLEAFLPELRAALDRAAPMADPPGIAAGCQVLDLGCGRGEFLALLRENGIIAAGVDSNRAMAGEGREKNLDVHERDMFEFLPELPGECMGGVTAFHVLEHLPFDRQVMLMDQCRRILAPGGLLAILTPDLRGAEAGGGDFYRDPTRLKPVHPEMLLVLARARGFVRAGIYTVRETDGKGVLQPAGNPGSTDAPGVAEAPVGYALLAYKG